MAAIPSVPSHQDTLREVHEMLSTAQLQLEELESSAQYISESEALTDVRGAAELVTELAFRLGSWSSAGSGDERCGAPSVLPCLARIFSWRRVKFKCQDIY